MAKTPIDDLLAANPRAMAHRDVIVKTLEAVKKLQDSGYGAAGYGLAPAQGGKAIHPKRSQKREVIKYKMTYCA